MSFEHNPFLLMLSIVAGAIIVSAVLAIALRGMQRTVRKRLRRAR